MNEYGDSFVGGNFLWFTGVIEDVNDPEEMGRYRVRCFGYHTESKGDIETEDLPFATVMMPITSASTSGVGQSATGLVQGSWVIGFFRDGGNAQDPVIMGSIPSMHNDRPDYAEGFSDPDEVYPLDGTLKKPDTPQPARKDYEDSAVYKSKAARSITSITPTGDAEPWSLPSGSNIAPTYPKNHVYQSESGHVVEFDDTSEKERISVYHKSGSYDEVYASGDRAVVIVGDCYEVVIKDKKIHITGDLNLNVDGNMNTKISKNLNLDVGGEMNVTVGGSQTITVGGDQETTITGNQNITASVTNINNNVNVTGTLDATVDVVAGTQNIKLVTHKHSGVTAGGTLTAVPQ
tara:strand:+ start:3491 stop:4534 length:1044 start_codon:yes stop_codon:yes gene_type:complete